MATTQASVNCPVCNQAGSARLYHQVYSSQYQKEYQVWECDGCRTKITTPQPTTDEMRGRYDEFGILGAGMYQKWSRKYRYIYNWIMEHHPTVGSLLEIGCNSGNQLRYFRERGWKVFGLEFSPLCRQYAADENKIDTSGASLVKFIQQNPARKFDLSLLIHTFEHVANPHEFLAELKLLLKPRGYLYLEIPNGDSLSYDLLKDFDNPLKIPDHLFLYNLTSLKTLLVNHGFAIVAERPYSVKEDGGELTNSLALWWKHRLTSQGRDNWLTRSLAWAGKRVIRFYPLRRPITHWAARRGKSASFAILCQLNDRSATGR